MVNNIENNVSNAAEYICSAKEETKKAVRYQKKSRRVRVPSYLPAVKLSQITIFANVDYVRLHLSILTLKLP